MKRPAPVTAAIIAMSILLLIPLMSFLGPNSSKANRMAVTLQSIMHGIPLAGLLLRKNWARIYSIVLSLFWAVTMVGVSIWVSGRHLAAPILPTAILMSSLLCWLAYSLAKGVGVKEYFVSGSRATEPALKGPTNGCTRKG
jgi:hypothetical protein